MKTSIIITAIVFLGAIIFGYFYFSNSHNREVADYTQFVAYACADDKPLAISFGDEVAQVSLANDQVVTLDQVSVSDESGTQFANEDNQIVLWVKDDSAFIEENGTTTYAACRVVEERSKR